MKYAAAVPAEGDLKLYLTITFCIIAAVLTLFVLVRFAGRRRPLPLKCTGLKPERVGAAELGYIISGQVSRRDVAALLLKWLCDGTVNADVAADDIYLFKGNADIKSAPLYEQMLYNELFRERDTLPLSRLSQLCPRAVKETEKRIALSFESLSARVFSRPFLIMQDAVTFAAAFPLTLAAGVCINDLIALPWLSALLAACVFVAAYSLNSAYCKLKSLSEINSKSDLRPKFILWTILMIAFMSAAGILCALSPRFGFYAFAGVCADIVIVPTTPYFRKYTEKGERERAEIDSLAAFFANPGRNLEKLAYRFDTIDSYFFEMLPYAWRLGLANIWLKQLYLSPGQFPPSLSCYNGTGASFPIVFTHIMHIMKALQ